MTKRTTRHVDARTPLIVQTDTNQHLYRHRLLTGMEYIVCAAVAFPTACLNGLAALSGDASNLGDLHSPDDLYKLFEQSGAGRIAYGVVAVGASEVVLFFLNRRYLLSSTKAALDLVKLNVLTAKSVVTGNAKRGDLAIIGEDGILVWSFITSLIFAEIGRKSLSFLGMPGEIAGFSLSLYVYFATRFASANMSVGKWFNKNEHLKQAYLRKLDILELYAVAGLPKVTVHDGNYNAALIKFLESLDNHWGTLEKRRIRQVCFNYITPGLGWLLVAATILPIMSSFMPVSVQGVEIMTHTNIGNEHYQNGASFGFGAFATALTLLFYEINIKELPKHFLGTAFTIYENVRNGDIRSAMKLLMLTLLACGVSYCTAIGFGLVAETAIESGYLSYLGDWVSRLIPEGLTIAVFTMFWSHLQDLVNQTQKPQVLSDSGNIQLAGEKVNYENVSALLSRPETDITRISTNRHGWFSCLRRSRPAEASANDMDRDPENLYDDPDDCFLSKMGPL